MKKIIGVFVLLFISCNPSKKNEPQVYNQEALGTYLSMTFFADEKKDFAKEVDSTIAAINQSMSTYIETSDISKINRGELITVDHMFEENFHKAKEIYEQTDAYFDPTVGLLVNYYGFGPKKLDLEINDKNTDSLMQYVGFNQVELNSNQQVIKNHPSVYIDFNALAKGYAVDRIGVLLEQHGINNFIIDIGGEIVAKGENLQRNGAWRVGIDRPAEGRNDERTYDYVVNLYNQAIATSGNYRKFSEDEKGNKFVHTINPKTGKSEKSDILSASVIASDCMTADAYATAFMSMGFEKTLALVQEIDNIEVVLIYVNQTNELNTYISKELKKSINQVN